MQLAYSTNAFTGTDLITSLNQIASLGYHGAEILCERPHWYPDDVTEEAIEEVRKTLAEHNLQVSNLNANTANSYYTPAPPENVFEPSLTNKNADIRKIRENIIVNAIRLASRIGASCISVTSGHPSPGCLPELAAGYFSDSLKRICEQAHRYEIKVGIEYEPGLIVERADEVLAIIHQVDSELLGVNLDIGHSFLNDEQPETTISALAGRIWNVHIEDIKNKKHFHLPPGDGDIPIRRYLKSLRQVGYEGFLTVELYSFPEHPIDVGKKSIDYLSALLTELKVDEQGR